MSEPSLALQKAVADRLKADQDLVALVPAASIFDRHGLPTTSPCIILGEGQTIRDPIGIADDSFRVALDLHVWMRGSNLVDAKRIGGAAAVAMRGQFWNINDHRVAWLQLEQARYLRDPSGEWAHGVLSFEAMLVEAAA